MVEQKLEENVPSIEILLYTILDMASRGMRITEAILIRYSYKCRDPGEHMKYYYLCHESNTHCQRVLGKIKHKFKHINCFINIYYYM